MNKNILLLIALIATLLTTTAQVCENIDAGDDVQMLCSDADATLTTTFIAPNYRRTTNYDINSQPLCPPVTYDGSRTFIQTDDEWSDFVIDIPFTFCFFENQYDQLLISGNGMVTFDLTMLDQFNQWAINAADQVPTTNWETNSIFGVYHDMNSNVQPRADRISYKTVGIAPNRVFIISFECLQYSCTTLLSKSQIKLYESSNVIDVRVDEKPVCNAWNGGRAVIGIQNKYGTVGVTPAGRENGVWTPPAGGELWRFVPNGDAMGYTLNWFEEGDTTNTILNVDSVTGLPNNSESITVNPQQETTYRVELTLIDQCNDATSVLTDTVVVTPGYDPSITDPIIINECETTTGSGVADFDLDQNTLILTGLNAADFNITYHPTEQDAIDGTAAITPLSPYNSTADTIWVRIEDVTDPTCYTIRSFDINVVGNSVSINYPSNTVCSSTNPTYLPDTISITGGTFTINNGGVIDAITGEVDVIASGMGTDGTGDFIIHYEIVASSCTVSDDFNLSITLQANTAFGYTSVYAATPADFCKNDANPIPNPAPISTGGTYTINNGGTIDAVTGEIDLTVTPASNTPYTVEYTIGGFCGNTSTFDITIHSNESAAFNYNVSYCLSNATNPVPNIAGTGGGTFTITLQGGAAGGTINAATGEIDLLTTPAGIYTITYTTPGTFCSDTAMYNVTIYASPLIDTPTNAVENACESFTLPAMTGTSLTGNQAYYTGTGGTGTSYAADGTAVLNYDNTATYPITIYLYDETNTTPNCFDEESFQLNIYPLPTATAPTSNLHTCDDGSGVNTGSFDTSLFESEVLGTQNPADFTVTYQDAADVAITMTNPFTSQTQTITAIVTNNTTNCTQEVDFDLIVDPLPVANAPTSNLEECDVNETGIANFDTSLLEQEILGAQSATDYSVSYQDALGTAIVMTNPFTSATQTITAIVTNTSLATNCTNTVDFTLTVNPLPTATAPTSNLEACDDGNGTNTASFDSSLFESEVLGTQNPADFTVTYQDAADVAITMTNPFTSQTQTITAIVTNNTTNCIKEVDFTITVNPLPTAIAPTSNLHTCDDGSGANTGSFDTSLFDSEVLGTQNPADFTVTYQDAADVAITMTNPFTSQTQTITAIVTNNTTNCTQEVDFDLVVDPLPVANAPTSNLEECDVNETGIANFDTSLLEQEILGTQSATDYSVSYQDALGTAIVMTNPFTSATQTITAIVTNTSLATNCTNTVDFTLTVNPLPTATAPTSNLEACDDGNGTNTASFDTSLFESEVLGTQNPTDFTVTYQDATDVDITMTNPFTSATQTITAIVTNNTTNCIKEVDFTITVNPLPTANMPTNLHACDDGTGTAIFDTSDFISDILGLSQLPTDYTITYTDQDATPNLIAITYPTFTHSFAAGVSTLDLIATVTNNTTGCMQTVDFTLIKDDPDVSDFSYPATHICESDTANPFPVFTADTLFGGTFSILNTDEIDDGATIVSNTGEIDLSTTIAGQSYNISYDSAGALNSFCPTTTVFTITIDAEVFADFTYPDATVCIDDSNPVPTVTGLAGGTFVIDPASATIDAATGIIDLTTTEAGTTYTIYYTTPNTSACTDTKSFDITVIGLPIFELDAQAYLCPDQDFVTLRVQNPSDTYTYEWVNTNDTATVIGVGETYDATEVGIYAVIATESVNFCTSTQIISVGMAEQAAITNISVNDFNRPNNSIIVEVTGGTADFTYYLIDSDGNEVTHQENNPIFENILPGTYEIRVEDNQGCSVVIYRTDIAILDYPRFFTPNGDGAYEYWQISNVTAIPYSNILIFDRFGKVLAQIDPNGPGWNGVYLGKPVPASDYWFTAEYLDPNTQLPRSVKGHFSIVRKSSFDN